MANTLTDIEWQTLLRRIESTRCTPFLGAGASCPQMPLGGDMAQLARPGPVTRSPTTVICPALPSSWRSDRDPLSPKQRIQRGSRSSPTTRFRRPRTAPRRARRSASADLPHHELRRLHGPGAPARAGHPREPVVKVAPWNDSAYIPQELKPSITDDRPTPARPLVFHLHGHVSVPESMVITEDDYVDFLVELGRNRDVVLPGIVQGAFTGTSLLFIGYRLTDWNFRVIHHALIAARPQSQQPFHVTVQVAPSSADETEYMTSYYGRMDVQVYWGSAQDFCAELHDRWTRFKGGHG